MSGWAATNTLRATIGSFASAVRSSEPYTERLNDQRNEGVAALALVETALDAAEKLTSHTGPAWISLSQFDALAAALRAVREGA